MKKKFSISKKIQGLQEMKEMGFNVPNFDFIPDYTELRLKDIDINEKFIPNILKEIVIKKIKKLKIQNGISVRSASFDEDTENKSAAGRYISFNGLCTKEEILKAIIKIWIHHRQHSENILCPIILQETHPSFYSGVAFKDNDTIIVESFYGACSNIVNGTIKPYTTIIKDSEISHIFNENNNFFTSFSIHKNIFKEKDTFTIKKLTPKKNNYVDNIYLYKNENKKILYVYGNRPSTPIKNYEDKILPQIIDITKKLDNKQGVDIEWGTDIDGNVYMYQFRKLTRKLTDLNIKKQNIETNNNDDVFWGIPVSKGIVEGTATYNLSNINENSILITQNDNIEEIETLSNIKGIVAYNGGILSHLSIICRELNIPCIVGVEKYIPDGIQISINGETGEIKIIKKGS